MATEIVSRPATQRISDAPPREAGFFCAPVSEESYVPQTKRWSYEELLILAQYGFFGDARLELIDGEIIFIPPIGPDHATSVDNTTERLLVSFAGKKKTRVQNPLDFGENGTPQPDVAVVALDKLKPKALPDEAELVVEISDSTLKYDQTIKASLYAAQGMPDYWIVNLSEKKVEVRRLPKPDANARFGASYTQIQIFARGEKISPLCAGEVEILVDELLP